MSEKPARRSTPALAFRISLVLAAVTTLARFVAVFSEPGFPGDSEAYTIALTLGLFTGVVSLITFWLVGLVIIGLWRWIFG